jgi:hypothetical protein
MDMTFTDVAAPREAFTMDPNLLVSVIRSQAGTLAKALLEGVMNSLDAGATRVDLTVDATRFSIADNGRGFASEEEIRLWFGRFGTPHAAGDAQYGRFRMGRGQLFSHAASVWTSNRFRLSVDINRQGLTYAMEHLPEPVRGCRIEAVLYEPLAASALAETLTELKKFVAFAPRPVYVNGALYGASAARLKNWTGETEDAWVRLTPDSEELLVYNQGVFVCAFPSWKVGMGGVVVSKRALDVNFARNAVMERSCPVWSRIRSWLERLVFAKLANASRLADGERAFLARRVGQVDAQGLALLRRAKVLTEPNGRHVPLAALAEASVLVHVPRATPLACQVHGNGTFVVTDRVIERFGAYSFEDFVERLGAVPGVLRPGVRLQLANEAMKEQGLGEHETLVRETLTRRQQAAFAALTALNAALAERLQRAGLAEAARELLVARQKRNSAIAWTDGRSYITANVHSLKFFEAGVDGALRWAGVLLHEYLHNTDDSESHDHGEVFLESFQSAVLDAGLGLATLAQQGLAAYLTALRELGLHRPQALTRQLARGTRTPH